MKINWKKVAIYSLPILAGGGIIWWLNKKKKDQAFGTPPAGPVVDATGQSAPGIKSSVSSNSSFPLKNGSKNSYVNKLQTALKISSDGIFGSQTEAALAAAAGISVIKDENQLNQVIKTLTTGAANTSRAQDLLTRFNAGGQAIYITKTGNWDQAMIDSYGALQTTGKMITLYQGKTYNNADYKIYDKTKLGNLIIQVTRGSLAGYYIGDPGTVTLVKP